MDQRAREAHLLAVMHPSVSFALLCLLCLAAGARALGDLYGRSLGIEDVEETLRALGPWSLMRGDLRAKSRPDGFEASAGDRGWCARDLAVVMQAIERREIWALKMLDASSKIPTGILDGNIIDMGMYDECVSTSGKSLGVEIQGRHCMYSIVPSNDNGNLPLYLTLSICLPASCNVTDLSRLFNLTVATVDRLKNLRIHIGSVQCSMVDPVVWDTQFIVCFSILMAFIGFLVICTVFDLLYHSYGVRHSTLRVLGSFSLLKNAASILSTTTTEENVPSINGIRFLSIVWIVLGHQYFTTVFAPNVNTVYMLEWIQSWTSLIVFTAFFAVDTFFILSGFLMTYFFLKEISRRRNFNVPMYYIHRFVRITPSVIALLVFTIVFLPKIGSGARWESTINRFFGTCSANWWCIALYIQNFVDAENLCLVHLWYLAADMQLFWISPLILYPLYARPKIGLGLLFAWLIASVVVLASIIGINKYPVESYMHMANGTIATEIFRDLYRMPYARAGPWIIGIMLGYELFSRKRTLSKTSAAIGWLLTAAGFAFCIFGKRSFVAPTYKYNATWETFFYTVSRLIWAAGISWIIFASVYDYAGPIGKLLNWKIYQPLARLSFVVYIIHMVYQLVDVASLRTSIYFSDYYVWQAFLSKMVASIAMAFCFSLMFESPILVLEKIIFKRNREPQYETQRDLATPEDEENEAIET